MNYCPPWEELSTLIDGELSTERELELRWHLDICTACTRHAAAVAMLKRAIGRTRAREIPSLALRRSVVARVPRRRRLQSRISVVAAPLFITVGAMLLPFVE
jgi:anti-sigma factor RsiW